MVSSSEVNAVIEGIGHEIRRKIILLLAEKGPMKYSSLLSELSIQSGVLNYHLSKMESLLDKDEDGTYSLSEMGILAYKLLEFLRQEIRKPQRLERRPPSPWTFLSEAVSSFLDLCTNPRRAFTHKGAGAVLVSLSLGGLLFLLSSLLGTRAIMEVFFIFLGTFALVLGLSAGIYAIRPSTTLFLTSCLRAQLPELILLLIRLALFLNLVRVGELEYSLLLIGIRYVVQPALALWTLILLLFATKESTNLDLSKSFVVVILTILVLRMVAKLLGFSQEIHVITF